MHLELSGTLNYLHFEKIIHLLTRKGEQDFLLNLEKVSFIDPYGLVGLITAARYCKQKEMNLKIMLPPSNVQAYMATMDFFNHAKEYLNISQGFISILFKKAERQLLEVNKISMHDYKEFVSFAELLDRRMEMMFNTRAGDIALKRVYTNLLEVCQNIEHSMDFGYVAAQKYSDPFSIKIGVMDLGIGIASALQSRYEKKGENLSDKRAIQLALQLNVTSRSTGGGLGLYQLSRYVKEHPGSELIIRSGTVRCHLKHNGTTYYEGLSDFPGTQIGLKIKF